MKKILCLAASIVLLSTTAFAGKGGAAAKVSGGLTFAEIQQQLAAYESTLSAKPTATIKEVTGSGTQFGFVLMDGTIVSNFDPVAAGCSKNPKGLYVILFNADNTLACGAEAAAQ